MACSRFTVGNSIRNSFSETLASRLSSIADTGTRVPLNTGSPLKISLSEDIAVGLLDRNKNTLLRLTRIGIFHASSFSASAITIRSISFSVNSPLDVPTCNYPHNMIRFQLKNYLQNSSFPAFHLSFLAFNCPSISSLRSKFPARS